MHSFTLDLNVIRIASTKISLTLEGLNSGRNVGACHLQTKCISHAAVYQSLLCYLSNIALNCSNDGETSTSIYKYSHTARLSSANTGGVIVSHGATPNVLWWPDGEKGDLRVAPEVNVLENY